MRQETRDRRQKTGDKRQETRHNDKRQETRDRRQETRERRQEKGARDRRQENRDVTFYRIQLRYIYNNEYSKCINIHYYSFETI